MTKDFKELNRIIWAIDPYLNDEPLFFKTAKCLAALTKSTSTVIEPVSIFTPPQIRNEFFGGIISKDSQTALAISRRLDIFLKKASLRGQTELTLLSQPYPSNRESAKTLVSYAKESGAELIVVSTHARRGIKRLLLGSFAETLILQPNFPILVVAPKTPPIHRFKNIIFPTDFSDSSLKAFQEFIPYIKSLGLKLTIYHRPVPTYAYIAPSFSVPMGSDVLSNQEQVAKSEADKWLNLAQDLGIEAKYFVDRKSDSVYSGVIAYAKKSRTPLIALASQSTPLISNLVGSTTRKLIRYSNLPIWILHPRLEEAESKSTKGKVA